MDVLLTFKLLYVKNVLVDFTIAHVLECADIVLMGNYVYKIMDTALMDAATTFFFLCAKYVKTGFTEICVT